MRSNKRLSRRSGESRKEPTPIRALVMTAALAAAAVMANASAQSGPTTNAPSVLLAWDASPDPRVNRYGLYYGAGSRNYTNAVVVSTNQAAISNLVRGVTYYFAATCVLTNGLESAYSAEVSYTPAPLPGGPTNFTLTVIQK